ncbi:hypothetical protein ACH4FX_01760 [Streptomyces sp. NPDC018019]|uniref:hypothetical protein n=1 Tax=Streptomyces sp. NPDC018019 TaxID=3365030 RepID=UPI0037BA8FB2
MKGSNGNRFTWFPRPLSIRPDTAGHPAHYTASHRPHSPPGAEPERTVTRTPVRTAARATARTPVRTPDHGSGRTPTSTPSATRGTAPRARMRTASFKESGPRTYGGGKYGHRPYHNQARNQRPQRTRNPQNSRPNRSTRSNRSFRPTPDLRPLSVLRALGTLVVVLTLLFSGTAAAKGGKTPFLTATGTTPAHTLASAPDPTPTPAAPPGAHGPPTELSPAIKARNTGIQYRRDNERDPGREKEKDRNQARRCTRTAQGEPSPYRRPTPPCLRTARSYPRTGFLTAHAHPGAAALTTSRPGVATRPSLHCLHCVFRC